MSKREGLFEKMTTLEVVYLLNLALLATHEIDSAYWKEWELLGLPGEIQTFLVLNFVVLLVAFVGLRQLALGARSGFLISLLVGFSGIAAFLIHGYFIVGGYPQFRLPGSIVVLVLTLVASVAQVALSWRALSPPRTQKLE